MFRYLALIQLTDQGIRDIGESADRAAKFAAEVKSAGGNVTAQYWAVGQHDGAVIFEAPDEVTAASLLLQLAREGYVRTQSLRLFDHEQFAAIVRK